MQRFFFSVLTMGLVMDALASTILHKTEVAVERDHRDRHQCQLQKVLDTLVSSLKVLLACCCTLGRPTLTLGEVFKSLCL